MLQTATESTFSAPQSVPPRLRCVVLVLTGTTSHTKLYSLCLVAGIARGAWVQSMHRTHSAHGAEHDTAMTHEVTGRACTHHPTATPAIGALDNPFKLQRNAHKGHISTNTSAAAQTTATTTNVVQAALMGTSNNDNFPYIHSFVTICKRLLCGRKGCRGAPRQRRLATAL